MQRYIQFIMMEQLGTSPERSTKDISPEAFEAETIRTFSVDEERFHRFAHRCNLKMITKPRKQVSLTRDRFFDRFQRFRHTAPVKQMPSNSGRIHPSSSFMPDYTFSSDVDAANALIQFHVNQPTEILPSKRLQGTYPENSSCLVLEKRLGSSCEVISNPFIYARKSLSPLLQSLDFSLVSFLLSVFWNDDQNRKLFDYFNYLSWHSNLRYSAAPPSKQPRRKPKNALAKRSLSGLSTQSLDLVIRKIAGVTAPQESVAALKSCLRCLEPTDPKFKIINQIIADS